VKFFILRRQRHLHSFYVSTRAGPPAQPAQQLLTVEAADDSIPRCNDCRSGSPHTGLQVFQPPNQPSLQHP
jgi:hypothetical protein